LKKVILGFIIIIVSCNSSSSPEELLPHIQGYWEISNVKQNDQIISEYNINTLIDYWQLNDDLSGFRKKVQPNLEGKITATQHSLPFTLTTINEELTVNYNDNGRTYKEVIVTANDKELVIIGDQGLIFTYKPYKRITMSNE